MAHRETISEYEHRRERLNRLGKLNEFTDNFLRSPYGVQEHLVRRQLANPGLEMMSRKHKMEAESEPGKEIVISDPECMVFGKND